MPWARADFCVFTHTNTHIYTRTHTRTHTHTHTHTQTHTHTCTKPAIKQVRYVYTYKYTRVCLYTHVRVCVCTHTHVYVDIYMYIYRCRRSSKRMHTNSARWRRPTLIRRACWRQLRMSCRSSRASYCSEKLHCRYFEHTATHCYTQQHTAAHCNTLQHTAMHYHMQDLECDIVLQVFCSLTEWVCLCVRLCASCRNSRESCCSRKLHCRFLLYWVCVRTWFFFGFFMCVCVWV